MGIKKFFKINWTKSILTILIFFIPFYRQIICPFVPPCFSIWYSESSILLESLGALRFEVFVIVLISSIIINYCISCTIIYIYKKLRKK